VDLHAPLSRQNLEADGTGIHLGIVFSPPCEIHAITWIMGPPIETLIKLLASQAGAAQQTLEGH